MSYAEDFDHCHPPDIDDPFCDDEESVAEVYGKTCRVCGVDKLHWERD